MDKRPLLRVQGLVKRFGGLLVTNNVSFDVKRDELHAVIGPNGAGKTTLITLLSGELQSESGSIVFDGQELAGKSVPRRAQAGLGRSYQISQIFQDLTALQNVMLAVQATASHSFSFIKAVAKDIDMISAAEKSLALCGLSERMNVTASAMAHGEHRQLELAMALAIKPRLLLLDEPMAGLSQAESGEMIRLLQELKKEYAIILVEHDMDAVFSLADRISVLVYGKLIATGTAEEIRNNEAVKEAYLGDQEEEI